MVLRTLWKQPLHRAWKELFPKVSTSSAPQKRFNNAEQSSLVGNVPDSPAFTPVPFVDVDENSRNVEHPCNPPAKVSTYRFRLQSERFVFW